MRDEPISLLVPVAGAISSAAAGGPIAEVFNEMSLVMAILGGIGGSVRFLVIRRVVSKPRRLRLAIGDALGSILVGAALSFGIGAMAPSLLSAWFGIEVSPDSPSTAILAACAFMIGMAQERILVKAGVVPEPKPEREKARAEAPSDE